MTYAVTRQFNLVLSVPIIEASWSIPLPVQPTPGPRSEQDARGLGDISLTGRWWVRKTEDHAGWNLSLGLGVKAPTGKYDAADEYPTLNG
ncbi:MAG TPA: transporter, partial [Candidatus Polarisedimenticolia bacterium]|nr:transporter [Candidatus Polarisedimenticolia bacterium]